jgi:hypothetical protein
MIHIPIFIGGSKVAIDLTTWPKNKESEKKTYFSEIEGAVGGQDTD